MPLDVEECDIVITRIYLEYDEESKEPTFQLRAEELQDQSALVK